MFYRKIVQMRRIIQICISKKDVYCGSMSKQLSLSQTHTTRYRPKVLILELTAELAANKTFDDFKAAYLSKFSEWIRALINHYDIDVEVSDQVVEHCAFNYKQVSQGKILGIRDLIPQLSEWRTSKGQRRHTPGGRNIDELFEWFTTIASKEQFSSNPAIAEASPLKTQLLDNV